MAEKGNQCVPLSDTGTFGVSLSDNFLPIQEGVREIRVREKKMREI